MEDINAGDGSRLSFGGYTIATYELYRVHMFDWLIDRLFQQNHPTWLLYERVRPHDGDVR